MPAFRFFDPWADTKNQNRPPTPAKVAQLAKVGPKCLDLADLAPPDTCTTCAQVAQAGPAAEPTFANLRTACAPAKPQDSSTFAGFTTFADPPGQNAISPTSSEAEEERAAIVEHDGGIPRAWTEGFARLDPDRPPGDVPLRRWQRFVDDVGYFLDSPFCAVAAALGWGPFDLFGCDRDRPFARIDRAGLLWLLNGDKLVALSENTATIERPTGARQTYRRHPNEPSRALAWELVPWLRPPKAVRNSR
jgi:hypothetical protein